MAPRQIKVDIISDIICPFCLLGQKQLEGALTKYNGSHPSGHLDATIKFLPYQLDPTNDSTEPRSKVDMYAKKFGPRAVGLRAQMADRFTAHGLKLHPAGEVSSSHLGHRLQTLALHKIPEKQSQLAEDLFLAYHTDGIHPSDTDVLARTAVKYDLFPSEQEAKTWLEGDECDEEVRKSYGAAQRMGVTGVPFFIVDNKYAISGAVGEDAFIEFFEERYGKEDTADSTPAATNGDGVCS